MKKTGARLSAIRKYLEDHGREYEYDEPDGLGSVDFSYRGVAYHVWEFVDDDGTAGVETNVRHGGHVEEITGDYEAAVIAELESW